MADEHSGSGAGNLTKRVLQLVAETARGISFRSSDYKISLPPTRGSVNIYEASKIPGTAKWHWILRLDTPHKGVEYHHVNINPRVAKIAKDPHIPIPAASVEVAVKTAWVLKKLNTILVPIAASIDCYRISSSAYEDYGQGTTRNTVQTATEIGGGWAGGSLGSTVGCTLGTAILPGIGSLVGSFLGGIGGGIGGLVGTEAVAGAIWDRLQYDIEVCTCKYYYCDKQYECRKYAGQPTDCCPRCWEYNAPSSNETQRARGIIGSIADSISRSAFRNFWGSP